MIYNINFIIIFFILILIFYYLVSNEKFQNNTKCSDIPSGPCTSSLCPSYCKASLTEDGENCYCVDKK